MAGYVKHVEFGTQFRYRDAVAAGNRMRERGNGLVFRAVHRDVAAPSCGEGEFGDPAAMVGGGMGGEDGDESQPFARKVIEHRPGVAWIDDRRAAAVGERPDVVVLERRDGYDLIMILLGHVAIIGDAAR